MLQKYEWNYDHVLSYKISVKTKNQREVIVASYMVWLNATNGLFLSLFSTFPKTKNLNKVNIQVKRDVGYR